MRYKSEESAILEAKMIGKPVLFNKRTELNHDKGDDKYDIHTSYAFPSGEVEIFKESVKG